MSYQDFETFMSQVDEILIKKTGRDHTAHEGPWAQFYREFNRHGECADAEIAVEVYLESLE